MSREGAEEALVGLPDSIRIGPHDFTLTVRNTKRNGEDSFGLMSYDDLTIDLSQHIEHPSKVVEVLMHEIMHAIYVVYGIEAAVDEEERAVTMLAIGLTAVHRDNPWLAEWIGVVLA